MSAEGFPEQSNGVVEQLALDAERYLDTHGLGPDELNAVITYNNHSGTVRDMIADERCPVGGALAEGYAAGGIEGVERKLEGLRIVFGSTFDIPIGDRTRRYHGGTLERDELLRPWSEDQRPDFLA
jgi:hypothetical protein